MKKYFLILFGSLFIFSACNKKDTTCNYSDVNVTASAAEITLIQNYLTTNSILAVQHPSGFFYKITTAGTGSVIANLCTTIGVKYTGKLINGTLFDQNSTGASFQLGQVIAGWQKGVPLIKNSGKITLYIPPSLGYGSNDVKDNTGKVIIPANSTLIFDIELVSVN